MLRRKLCRFSQGCITLCEGGAYRCSQPISEHFIREPVTARPPSPHLPLERSSWQQGLTPGCVGVCMCSLSIFFSVHHSSIDLLAEVEMHVCVCVCVIVSVILLLGSSVKYSDGRCAKKEQLTLCSSLCQDQLQMRWWDEINLQCSWGFTGRLYFRLFVDCDY